MYEKKIIENLRKYAHIYAYDNQELSETCLRAYNSIEMLLYKYKMSLNEIEELQKPQWISVEERLPEEAGHYLVAINGESCEASAWWYKGKLLWHDPVEEYENYDGVTHWMPLPEPPKEETDG